MFKTLLCNVAFLALAFAANAQSLSPVEVKALLARIRDHRASAPNLAADFRQQRKVHLLDEPLLSTGKVWFQAPNKFRLEVKGNSPSVTVNNGQQLWIYYPKFNSAERYSLTRHSPLDAAIAALTAGLSMQNLEATYRVTARKEGSGYVMQLEPRSPSIKRLFQSLEITLNDRLQATHTDILQPNGDRMVTDYTSHSAAAIPASQFQFTPPAGAEVSTPLGR